MKKDDLKKINLKKLDPKKMLIVSAIVFVAGGILGGVFESIMILNVIFMIIGLVGFAGVVYFGVRAYKNRLIKKKEKNFTCQACGKKFIWNDEKITCTKTYEDIKANNDGKGVSYWYAVSVEWTCECGHVNKFSVRFCMTEPYKNSIEQLIHDYYLGKILTF